ncbi:nucleotide-diphospho-sugar transferase [Hesseltinella vesiculosa]|uniref:Nucleotide-diphospho-sugar transferase n=1 Tax=Hesseltinella vesiculosa TaxID=101127 RepID=A0A1X2GD39_9FUNG|nr:nucleotide-diphospho-sugar transferase [Hesseltinella vesiculosa]
MPKKCAWAVVLTSENNYLKGIVVLQYVLSKVLASKYPLLVLYTPNVQPAIVEKLTSVGCLTRPIDPIVPPGPIEYSHERFRNTWTKLAVWDQEDYDRLVMVDADMLPLANMDELMTLEFPQKTWVAASHACTCNPQQMKKYPADWIPSNCEYTFLTTTQLERQVPRHYFNSGLIVLRPDRSVFRRMIDRLFKVGDLNGYIFPDQDFLNEEFFDQWTELPYIYNALKPMSMCHAKLWNLDAIKNIHYILSKPWDVDWNNKTEQAEYYPLYKKWVETYDEARAFYRWSP